MASSRPVAVQFGKNLSRCRKGRSLSRSELGRRAELNETGVAVLERGEQRPRIDTAAKLAGALEVPTCELLRGIEWKPAGTGPGEFAPFDQVEISCRHADDFGTELRESLWDLGGEEIV